MFGVKWVYYSTENGNIKKEKVDVMEKLHDSIAVRAYNFIKNNDLSKIDMKSLPISHKGFVLFNQKNKLF